MNPAVYLRVARKFPFQRWTRLNEQFDVLGNFLYLIYKIMDVSTLVHATHLFHIEQIQTYSLPPLQND